MQNKILVSVIVVLLAALAFTLWFRGSDRSPAPTATTDEPAHPSMGGMIAPAQDPGAEWQKPGRWVEEPAAGMRLATYRVPAPDPAGEGARCAVYYFGPGQGGGTEANLERWIGEFENPGKPARRTFEVNGLPVAQVEVTGTYLAHAGAEAGSAGWTLLGAVVEGPHGAIFFKLTGPASTVAPAAKEFEGLLKSLRPK